MDPLTELAIKYKTDKWGKHNYTPVYYNLFKKNRESVKKILEIGAGEGLGLRMFRDFFPNAMIYGAEIEEGRLFEEDRIKVIKCDQTSIDDLIDLTNITDSDLDIVIDDGSHKPEDQLYTCTTLFPTLDKKSIYIIEDVAEPELIDKLPSRWDCQMITCGKRYDDRLIIVRHK